MRYWKHFVPFTLALALLAGCAAGAGTPVEEPRFVELVELEEIEIEAEAVALADSPAPLYDLLVPVASGAQVKKADKAQIDYSNTADGYVMAQYTAATQNRVKVKIVTPSDKNDYYQYNLTPGEWTAFPLSDGNGEYKVSVLEQNPATGKYAVLVSLTLKVELKDEFAPFLRPNQYVDYAGQQSTLAKAKELIGTETDALKKVEKVYQYAVENLTYDKEKAKTVQSGYLPVLDSVLSESKGICFDYAALMVGMLRSQGVPCKLVVGYAGTAYHAWVNVWSEATGWVTAAIYFDGTTWQRMDPTFASSAKSSEAILKYIGDGQNYSAKFLY